MKVPVNVATSVSWSVPDDEPNDALTKVNPESKLKELPLPSTIVSESDRFVSNRFPVFSTTIV